MLDDATGLDDVDAVGLPDGAHAVGNQDARDLQLIEAVGHDGLRSVVERAGGFVQIMIAGLRSRTRAISRRCR